jgi:hypothetical protein
MIGRDNLRRSAAALRAELHEMLSLQLGHSTIPSAAQPDSPLPAGAFFRGGRYQLAG